MNLRPYQTQIRQDVAAAFAAGKRRPLVVLPTGGGKTVIFADMAERARGARTLIVAHRRELVRQASNKLPVKHGIISPGHPETRDSVQVGSVQTLTRRLDRLPRFDLVILDEGHHAVAGGWLKLIESQPQALVCGFTATPQRLDGRGLGDVYDHMVLGPSTRDLVEAGFLVPSRVFAPAAPPDVRRLHMLAGDFNPRELESVMDRPSVTGDAVAHYERHCPGVPAIAFCVSVAHARNTAEQFRNEGWRAQAVWGDMDPILRDKAFRDLESGALHVLISCDLISEGVDVPRVGCVILLRPTESLQNYLQSVGRGMRLYPGKTRLDVLDHAGNVLRHGMPDEPRAWTLDGKKKKAGNTPPTRQCPECFAIHAPAAECPSCGFDYAAAAEGAARREIERREGELTEMTEGDRRLAHLRDKPLAELLKEAVGFDDVDEIRRARGYAPGWTPRQVAMRKLAPGRTRGEEFLT